MNHAISLGARTYNWPSIQKASAMIFWRIYAAQVCTEGGSSPLGPTRPTESRSELAAYQSEPSVQFPSVAA